MPDTSTEVALATTTLSSVAANITFSNISGSYSDLRLVFTGTVDSGGAGSGLRVQVNSDSSTIYSFTEIYGTGATAASTGGPSNPFAYITNAGSLSTTVPAFASLDFFNYAGSTFKTFLSSFSNDRNGSGVTEHAVHLYQSTTAITSIKIYPANPNFATGTTATLYGIL